MYINSSVGDPGGVVHRLICYYVQIKNKFLNYRFIYKSL